MNPRSIPTAVWEKLWERNGEEHGESSGCQSPRHRHTGQVRGWRRPPPQCQHFRLEVVGATDNHRRPPTRHRAGRSYPAISLAQARALSTANQAAVAEGRDPLAEKRREAMPNFRDAALWVYEAGQSRLDSTLQMRSVIVMKIALGCIVPSPSGRGTAARRDRVRAFPQVFILTDGDANDGREREGPKPTPIARP